MEEQTKLKNKCVKCGGEIDGKGYMDSNQCIECYKREEGSE